MQTVFTKDEKEVLFRILGDVKINPLDSNTIPLVTVIQSIAKKVFAAPSEQEDDQFDSVKSKPKKQA